MCIVRRCSGSKPGSTAIRRAKLRSMRPAPTERRSASVTSATTKERRKARWPPTPPRVPCLSACWRSTRERRKANAIRHRDRDPSGLFATGLASGRSKTRCTFLSGWPPGPFRRTGGPGQRLPEAAPNSFVPQRVASGRWRSGDSNERGDCFRWRATRR
jgi:hypothetical protein